MTKIIGVTGGIGCGKSTLIEIMKKKFNVLFINTDSIAKYLMSEGNISYDLILSYFGKEILNNKEIDKKKLSKIVMNNKRKLKKLNSFTHPYVIKEVLEIIEKEKDNYDYIMLESALLLDTDLCKICDETWNVSANLEIRIDRLQKYRGYSKEEALNIIKNQKSSNYYIENTTRTILNNKEDGKDIENILDIITK